MTTSASSGPTTISSLFVLEILATAMRYWSVTGRSSPPCASRRRDRPLSRPAGGRPRSTSPTPVLVRIRAGQLGVGQPEPERLGRVDLCGMGEQRLRAGPQEVADLHLCRDAIVVVGSLEPLLVVRRRASKLEQGVVHSEQAGTAPYRVVELARLPRRPSPRVPGRVAGALERGHRDVVHLQ